MDTFYLGTHEKHWLWGNRTTVPLFVSHVRLTERRSPFPPATTRWALDSGGFTQLQQYGTWTIPATEYAAAARRYAAELGRLDFAATQDWMCEPWIIGGGWHERQHFAGTHLTVAEHQRRTVTNYLQLRTLDDSLPWIPTLQGWERDDYLRCWGMYEHAGIDLAALPVVGLGTVCRRQDTTPAAEIVRSLAPLRLHGFGIKTTGLGRYGHRLTSSDSMSWSVTARHQGIRLPGHTHQKCANCLPWATQWRQDMLGKLGTAAAKGRQLDLFDRDENWALRCG